MPPSATPKSNILSIILLVAAVGCFHEPANAPQFRCDSDNPCPAGQFCGGGLCQAQPSLDDLGQDASADGRASDGPDLMSMPSGCADNGGVQVGSAWACPGKFTAGQARSLCRTKWSVPADATRVDLAACNKVNGFYASAVNGKWIPPWGTSVTCMPGGMFENKILFGCGAAAGSDYQPDSAAMCSGYFRAVNCPAVSKSWDCPASMGDIDHATNTVAADGVLCVFTG